MMGQHQIFFFRDFEVLSAFKFTEETQLCMTRAKVM